MTRALLAMVVVVVVSACEAPPVVSGADARQSKATARIEGTVVASTAARGPAVLFLFDAAKPPPPAGTGRPLAFTVVTEEALFHGAAPGLRATVTAPFAFSLVASGKYLVQGFIDSGHDFVPWYGVTAGMNAGDVGGGVGLTQTFSGILGVSVVEVKELDGQPQPLLNLVAEFGDELKTPVDRPVFSLPSDGALQLGATATRVTLTLAPMNQGLIHQAQPAFLVRLVDDDLDGKPDDANGDGVPDAWPRVVVRKLEDGAASLAVETSADREHVDTKTGATVPADGVPDVTVLAAGFDLRALLPRLVDDGGHVLPGPLPVSSLDLEIKPLALDVSTPGSPQVVKGVPSGRYAVTVIQSTGQAWTVPNELAPAFAPGLGLPSVASQGGFLQVP